MKKLIVVAALLLVFAMVLSGCGGNTNEAGNPSTPNAASSSGSQQTPEKQNDPEKPENDQAKPADDPAENPPDQPTDTPSAWQGLSYQESLVDKIPFSVDLGVGWEYRDLTVNGIHRRITVTYEMDSSVIHTDPCFTYYRADIIGEGMYAETVAVGREFFTDFITEYVRSEKPDEIDMELFEYDFKASTFKGKDKEYIICSFPAAWEPNTATLVIATDQGKLLADSMTDKSYQVTLQGDDANRYMDYYGNTNFFSFSSDYITYLMVSQRVDGVTYLKEYSVAIDNDQITSVETGKTYTTKDTVPDQPGLAIH